MAWQKKHSILFVIITLALALYYFFAPTEYSIFPVCPIYKYTGYYCAGCGIQRSLHNLLHFEWLDMLRNNIFLPVWIAFGLDYIYKWGNEKKVAWVSRMSIVIPVIIAMLLYMVLRNLHYPIFSYLVPIG